MKTIEQQEKEKREDSIYTNNVIKDIITKMDNIIFYYSMLDDDGKTQFTNLCHEFNNITEDDFGYNCSKLNDYNLTLSILLLRIKAKLYYIKIHEKKKE